MYTFKYTYNTSEDIKMEVDNAPTQETTNQTPQGNTSYDVLRKIIADTLTGDIPQDCDNNPPNNNVARTHMQSNHSTTMCPSHLMDMASLYGRTVDIFTVLGNPLW